MRSDSGTDDERMAAGKRAVDASSYCGGTEGMSEQESADADFYLARKGR